MDTRKSDQKRASLLRQAETLANPWRVAWQTTPSWYAEYPSILFQRPYIRPTREMLETVGLPQEYIDLYLNAPLKDFEVNYDDVVRWIDNQKKLGQSNVGNNHGTL